MQFEEQDVQFEQLSGITFEELCVDLLIKLGFHAIVWRQGGGDSGRDIEASYTTNNPLTGSYEERWFFECKNHKSGINVEDLATKVAWAQAEKPRHLVVFTSSYITNPAREWLHKTATINSFQVHLIERKNLIRLLLNFPELVGRYFIDPDRKLLQDAMRAWRSHNVLPDPVSLWVFQEKIPVQKLSLEEMVFVYFSYKQKADQILEWSSFEDVEFNFDHLFPIILNNATYIEPLFNLHPVIEHHGWFSQSGGDEDIDIMLAMLEVQDLGRSIPALYLYVRQANGISCEMLLLNRATPEAIVRKAENTPVDEKYKLQKQISRTRE